MKSQIVLSNKRRHARRSMSEGFTLIEVLVVVGLLVVVFAVGALTNVGMYTRELSRSEQSDLVAVLQKARNQAMNNVNATEHGVYFGNDIECYYVFEGTSYGGDPCEDSGNQDRNTNINSSATFEEVYFEQLSGNPSESGDITMNDTGTGRERIITLQANGLIISQPPAP